MSVGRKTHCCWPAETSLKREYFGNMEKRAQREREKVKDKFPQGGGSPVSLWSTSPGRSASTECLMFIKISMPTWPQTSLTPDHEILTTWHLFKNTYTYFSNCRTMFLGLLVMLRQTCLSFLRFHSQKSVNIPTAITRTRVILNNKASNSPLS